MFLNSIWRRFGHQKTEQLAKITNKSGAYSIALRKGPRTEILLESMVSSFKAEANQKNPTVAKQFTDGQRVLRDDFVCHQPFHFPTVLCDGQVIGCEQDFGAQLPMGTLSDDVSFDKIWFSSQAAGVREQIRDHQDEISFCQNCPFKDRTTDRKECSIDAMQVNPDLKLPLPVG